MPELLPQDPAMLLSVINMKLRDSYSSLDELCSDMDIDKEKLITALKDAGYEYNTNQNRFW